MNSLLWKSVGYENMNETCKGRLTSKNTGNGYQNDSEIKEVYSCVNALAF